MKNHLRSVCCLLCRFTLITCLTLTLLQVSTNAQNKFPTGTYSAGEFSVTFNADGTHAVSAGGNIVVKGVYTIKDDQILLTDKEGEYACGGDVTGSYKWKFDGKSLTFSVVSDDCDGRKGGLTSQPFNKK